MKKHDVTAKELHNGFKDEYGKTPDEWINEDLRDWFGKGGKGGVGGGGWDRYNSKVREKKMCKREPQRPETQMPLKEQSKPLTFSRGCQGNCQCGKAEAKSRSSS